MTTMTKSSKSSWRTIPLLAALTLSACAVINDFGLSDDTTGGLGSDGTSGDDDALDGTSTEGGGTLGAEGGLPPDDAIESWSRVFDSHGESSRYRAVTVMSDGTIMLVGNVFSDELTGIQHVYTSDGLISAIEEPTFMSTLDDVCELSPGWSRGLGQSMFDEDPLFHALYVFDRQQGAEGVDSALFYEGPYEYDSFERGPTTLACDGLGGSFVGVTLQGQTTSLVAYASGVGFSEEIELFGPLGGLDYDDGVLEVVVQDSPSGDPVWQRILPGDPPFDQIALSGPVSGFDVRGDRAAVAYTDLTIPASAIEVYDRSGVQLQRHEQLMGSAFLVRAQALGPSGELAVAVAMATDAGEEWLFVLGPDGDVDWAEAMPVTESSDGSLYVIAHDMAIDADGAIVVVGEAPEPGTALGKAWVARWAP